MSMDVCGCAGRSPIDSIARIVSLGRRGAYQKNRRPRGIHRAGPRTLALVAPVHEFKNSSRLTTMGIDVYQPPAPPAHLSPSVAQWWATTVDRYILEEHHIRLLQLLCEAWDRAQEAREQLAEDGLTVPGREGGIRPHPCIAVERDSRLAVARLVRELDLDIEPPRPERVGPAGVLSNRGGRGARKSSSS
jgi:P27 family predicted phage terminase small subunit